MTKKGPRRIEIERRLALFHANRPRVIARELGVSLAWICEISAKVKDAAYGGRGASGEKVGTARTPPQSGRNRGSVR